MKKTFFALFLFLALVSSTALAVTEQGSMKIYAVTTEGQGLVATLSIEIEPGTGKIWSAVTPLVGTTTQNAERTAVSVAKKFSREVNEHDYKFTISSNASIVEGPSAGAAMTLLLVSMLSDRHPPSNVSITGTINEDGSVGAVGGGFEKVREAGKTGVKLFLIPKGEAIQTVKLPEGVKSVNLIDYAPKNFGVKVAEVETIDEALKFAFSDIEEIDVNVSAQESVPEFVPQKLLLPSHLGSFKVLTTNYINKTRQIASEARNALSSSLLEDPAVINFLLETLNASEQTISRAEILNEQNYLYSAANFAFLARVNAVMVKEVSVNPNILDDESSVLDLKLLELQRELSNFEGRLSGNMPRQGFEWFVSAQQRFTYSKISVSRLLSSETIVVGGTDEDKTVLALQRLQDYAFAAAWLDVSKDFYNLSAESDDFVAPSPVLAADANRLLAEAEKSLAEVGDESGKEDILRRTDSAKAELGEGWFESALIDAASAKALADAENLSAGKSNDDLRQLLQDKIVSVEAGVADSNSGNGWAELYLDHAKYFLASADYYSDKGLESSASGNLASGLSLALLSENVFSASSLVAGAYASAPAVQEDNGPVPVSVPVLGGNAGEQGGSLYIISAAVFFLGFGLAVLLVVLMFGALARSKRVRNKSLLMEMASVEKSIKEIEGQYAEGKMKKEDFESLKYKYVEELQFLELERRKLATHTLSADAFASEIDAYNERMRELKRHLKEKIISHEEFDARTSEYIESISSLKEKLEAERKAVADERKEFESGGVEALMKKSKPMLPVAMGNEEPAVVPAKGEVKVKKQPPEKTKKPAPSKAVKARAKQAPKRIKVKKGGKYPKKQVSKRPTKPKQ